MYLVLVKDAIKQLLGCDSLCIISVTDVGISS